MRAIVVKVPAVGDCICYKGNTFFDCIYMVRHPEKVNRQDERALLKKQESIESYKERLGSRIGTMTDEKLKILKKMNIELINKDTKTYDKDTKRKLIYRTDNAWYAVIDLKPTHKTQEPKKDIKVGSKNVSSKSQLNKETKNTHEPIKDIKVGSKNVSSKSQLNKETKNTHEPKKDIKVGSKNVSSKSQNVLKDTMRKLKISKKNINRKMRVKVGGTEEEEPYMNDMIKHEIELRKFLRREYLAYYFESFEIIEIIESFETNLTNNNDKTFERIGQLLVDNTTPCKFPSPAISPVSPPPIPAGGNSDDAWQNIGEKRPAEPLKEAHGAKMAKVMGITPPFKNPIRKIMTELRHDFVNLGNWQNLISRQNEAVTEDNYVLEIFRNKIMDNPSESEKFAVIDFMKDESTDNRKQKNLVSLIGDGWNKLRKEYSPDMEISEEKLEPFLISIEGDTVFKRKYTLGRIMDPISTNQFDSIEQFENDIMSIVSNDTQQVATNYEQDYEAMTEITKDFFDKLGYKAEFEFTAHSLNVNKVSFTIQNDKTSVELTQGFFSIQKVTELMKMNPNQHPENIKTLFSWIEVKDNYPKKKKLLPMLFKSLGDHLQIYMAKYASNLDEKNTFFITSKDRIAFATAVEIDTPIIFKSNC